MKKLAILSIIAVIFLTMGCNNGDNDDGYSNRISVGNKYPFPLKTLSECIFNNEIYVYLDGGNSCINETTGKWQGNGPHMVLIMSREGSSTSIPTGSFTLGDGKFIDVNYSENFNNEGMNYIQTVTMKDGVLTTSYNEGSYKFDFYGNNEKDSLVTMNFEGGVSAIFDYSDK